MPRAAEDAQGGPDTCASCSRRGRSARRSPSPAARLHRLRQQRARQLDHHHRQRDAGGGRGDPGRPAPARHQHQPRRQVALHPRLRRQPRAGDGHRDAHDQPHAALRAPTRSSACCTPPATRSTSPTRTTTSSPRSTSRARSILAEIPVGIEPEGMGVSPDGKMVVNTSETTNMAHFIDTETYEIYANVLVDQRPRFAEFTDDGKLLYVSAEIGGTVSVIDPATRRDRAQDRVRGARRPAGGAAAGRRARDRGRLEGLRGARARRTGSRWSTARPGRCSSTCWSASGSGSSPSPRTRS